MNAISAFIAKVGVNPIWIAANAHFWFAFSILMVCHGSLWAIGAVVIAAAVKEFWFDANNEVPKQTAFDNWTDFAGYVGGALAAWLYLYF